MKKVLAVLLIALGTLALIFRGFDLPGQKREAHLGPVAIAVDGRRHVKLPVWLGAAMIAGGAILLLVGRK
jgi:hypothetical protein